MTASAILLLRHATPEPVQPGASQRRDNDRPLSSEGRIAARQLAADLLHEPIGAVFSSPYRRSLETVEPIAVAHRLTVRVHLDLRERRLAAAPLGHREFLDAVQRTRIDPKFALPGGECTADVLNRAVGALRDVVHETPSGIAVAGTHGGLISILRWQVGEQFTVEDALAEPMPAMYRLSPLDQIWAAFA